MATTNKLRLGFKDATGKSISATYNYADPTKGAFVRALMEGMIANGAIYATAPASIVDAAFITTTETPVEL